MIFGLPAVLQSQYLALSDAAGFARNQFAVNLGLSTPQTHVAGPNEDTLYGFSYLDLADGPQVIEVLATHGRYSPRPAGTGRLPHGIEEIRATTKRLLALVRTEVKNPADLAAAQAIQTSYTTGPLSRYPRQRVSLVVAARRWTSARPPSHRIRRIALRADQLPHPGVSTAPSRRRVRPQASPARR